MITGLSQRFRQFAIRLAPGLPISERTLKLQQFAEEQRIGEALPSFSAKIHSGTLTVFNADGPNMTTKESKNE